MIFPDYLNNNIVNLAGTILKAFDINPLYPALKELEDLKKYNNIILLVIDGLGYKYFSEHCRNSFLEKYYVKKLCSVFPSTTASAITSLETGVAPQQHGITGWFMLLKELGVVAAVLPFTARYGGQSFSHRGIQREDIFTEKRITDRIRPSFTIYPEKIIDGKVNRKNENILTFKKLGGMLSQIKKAVSSSNKRKFIYAYWDGFDAVCHWKGCASINALEHLILLDKNISSLAESLKNSGSLLIVTADHGLIDTEKSRTIYLNEYPEIYETLSLPLCGEPRVAYCYVREACTKDFEKHVREKLGYCCEIYKSSELITKGVFGLYEPVKTLWQRTGDYVLIMKENYAIKDKLLNEKTFNFIGNHGGTSEEEMFIPLIIIK